MQNSLYKGLKTTVREVGVAVGVTSGKRCPMVQCKISEHCKKMCFVSSLIWEGKRVVWFAKHSGSGRREGKGMTSGRKVGEGVAEAVLRGVAYVPALGGWDRRGAPICPWSDG